MLIERAQAQGRDGNITICHVLWKKAILLHKRPKVEYSFSLTVVEERNTVIKPEETLDFFREFWKAVNITL